MDGVFIDAFATYYPEDENQQVAFVRETAKLWDFISSKGNFTFKSIQDILDELHVCQEETAKDIEMLKKENEDRKVEIEVLNSENGKRKTEIESLDEHVNEEITMIGTNIDLLEEENGNRKTETDTLFAETDNLEQELTDFKIEIEADLEALSIAPLGTILAWTPKPDKDTSNPISLPDGWIPCDGRQIKEGIWQGRYTPDLNEARRFLRGSPEKNVLAVEEDSIRSTPLSTMDYYMGRGSCHNGGHMDQNFGLQDAGSGKDEPYCHVSHDYTIGSGSETKPKNMNVVWIMKVK